MSTFKRDPRGRGVFFVVALGILGTLSVVVRASDGAPVCVVLLAGWIVACAGYYLLRYTGEVQLGHGEIRVKPHLLRGWSGMVATSVRHLRQSPPLRIMEYWGESIRLIDDGGRSVRIPPTMEAFDSLRDRIRNLVLPVVREKRMAEWHESWSVRFRCPGTRALAHSLVAAWALAGAGLGTLLWQFWNRLREPAMTVVGVAMLVGLVVFFVFLRRRSVWFGAEVLLEGPGLRVRRVDFDRTFSWRSVRGSWMEEGNRVHLDLEGQAILLPAAIEDRELLHEFVEMARRRAAASP